MWSRGITEEVGSQRLGQGYPIFSWYCIMCGMGIFPDHEELRPPTAMVSFYNMDEIDNLLARSAAGNPSKTAEQGAAALVLVIVDRKQIQRLKYIVDRHSTRIPGQNSLETLYPRGLPF